MTPCSPCCNTSHNSSPSRLRCIPSATGGWDHRGSHSSGAIGTIRMNLIMGSMRLQCRPACCPMARGLGVCLERNPHTSAHLRPALVLSVCPFTSLEQGPGPVPITDGCQCTLNVGISTRAPIHTSPRQARYMALPAVTKTAASCRALVCPPPTIPWRHGSASCLFAVLHHPSGLDLALSLNPLGSRDAE